MEEKKLTDEEIIKDIERSTGMPSYWKTIVLDIIHRLQGENERLTKLAELRLRDNEDTCRLLIEKEKLVDELKEEKLSTVCDLNMRIVELDNELKQAVKETAKEILQILQGYNYDGEIDELIAVIGERYGVEVE